MTKITQSEFYSQYPKGIIVDLADWDYELECSFIRDKKVVLYTYAEHAIAIVNYTFARDIDSYCVVPLYNEPKQKVLWMPHYQLRNLIFQPLSTANSRAYKIRNDIEAAYPEKNIEYNFHPPLSRPDFDILKKRLAVYVVGAEMKPAYSSTGLIGKVQVSINANVEKLSKILQDKLKSGELFKKDEEEKQPDFYRPLLNNFPESTKVFRTIPRKTIVDRFPLDNGLLLTLGFYMKAIYWLYKLSESTLKVSADSPNSEIHVILIDMNSFPTAKQNRRINGTTFEHIYFYGLFQLSEEKFLTLLDKLIPYQTVYVLKVARSGGDCYQIWSGIKNTTLKGTRVKQYVHTEWFNLEKTTHYDKKNVSKTTIKLNKNFTLAPIGNDLPTIMANFLNQIQGHSTVAKVYTKLDPATSTTHKAKKASSPPPPAVTPTPSNTMSEPISQSKQLMLYTHILAKLEIAIKENYNRRRYTFEIFQSFSHTLIDEYKKTFLKITSKRAANPIIRSIYEAEIEACKKMAGLLQDFYTFKFKEDSITFSKKSGVAFSKLDLIRRMSSYYTK